MTPSMCVMIIDGQPPRIVRPQDAAMARSAGQEVVVMEFYATFTSKTTYRGGRIHEIESLVA